MHHFAMNENEIATHVVHAAYRIHSALGPGLFESVYEALLASDLERRGLIVARQQGMPIVYEGITFDLGFRADLLVEDAVIVEVKSITEVAALHKKQLLTYLRLTDKRLGLLINFNMALIKQGITRMVNGLEEAKSPKSCAPLRQHAPACATDRLR